jgi:predicted AlkP superfamily pyrophosphatase or phosphodiesterase
MRPVLPALGLLAAILGGPRAADAARPSLVVVVVVDQLGAHYVRRWGHLLTEGVGPLARRGAFFRRGLFAFANTETSSGHATIATGAWPNVHGLVANTWYDASGRAVYCLEDLESGRSPKNLETPGIADALKLSTLGRAKTISLAIKDRAAIAMGGTRPTLVAWYDLEAGRMVAGKWPGVPPPPEWFQKIALERTAAASFGKEWVRLRSNLDYSREAGPDDLPIERDIAGVGRSFPRTYGQGLQGPADEAWRRSYAGTPAALDVLASMALTAIDEERLGRRGTVDYLAIGVSTLDYSGHWWGSHSQETLDVLLRVDRFIGELMGRIDLRLGEGSAVVVVTGDHGFTPTPEEAVRSGVESRRIPPEPLIQAANEALAREFGKEEISVLDLNPPRIYLSPTRPGVDRLRIARRVAEVLAERPELADAIVPADLGRWPEPLRSYFERSLFPGRNPDVLVLHRAHELIDHVEPGGHGIGTAHGSPYAYDTTVPILIAGPGVRRGSYERPMMMTRVAPTVAALIGIEPPAAAMDRPLPAVER